MINPILLIDAGIVVYQSCAAVEKEIQWDKNMEEEFMQFTLGMIKFLPKKWTEKKSSSGVMTIVATPA